MERHVKCFNKQFIRVNIEPEPSKLVCIDQSQIVKLWKEKCPKPEDDLQRSRLDLEFQAAADKRSSWQEPQHLAPRMRESESEGQEKSWFSINCRLSFW